MSAANREEQLSDTTGGKNDEDDSNNQYDSDDNDDGEPVEGEEENDEATLREIHATSSLTTRSPWAIKDLFGVLSRTTTRKFLVIKHHRCGLKEFQ